MFLGFCDSSWLLLKRWPFDDCFVNRCCEDFVCDVSFGLSKDLGFLSTSLILFFVFSLRERLFFLAPRVAWDKFLDFFVRKRLERDLSF
jgi:hypothetical protein